MRKLINSKEGDFNFEWMFAIVAGVVILLIAIYIATKAGNTIRYQSDTEVGKQISIITDPLQAGFSSGSFGKIIFQQETRLNNDCFDLGFGKNEISVASKSNVGAEWQKAGVATSIYNKYIFSRPDEGKDFYVSSKPFLFPYKIADLIFINTKEYCFVSVPKELLNSVKALGPNIKTENCSDNSTRVCFGSSSCDINIHGSCSGNCASLYDSGYVEKYAGQMKLDYYGNLMYAAIFSDKDVYECNVNRLLYRGSRIAELYSQKAGLMSSRDCSSNLQGDLLQFSGILNTTAKNLLSVGEISKELGSKANSEVCKIW